MRSFATICLFLSYFTVGILVLLGQVLVEPIALKNVIAQLEKGQGGRANLIVVFICVFVFCAVLQNVGKALTAIIQKFMTAREVQERSGTLYGRVVMATKTAQYEQEPEMLVKRIMRDVETVASLAMRVKMELPLLIVGLLAAVIVMLRGTYWIPDLGLGAAQKGNVVLTFVVIAIFPLQFTYMLFNRRMMVLEQRQADTQENECFVATEIFRGVSDIRLCKGFNFALERVASCLSAAKKARFRFGAFGSGVHCVSNLSWAISQAAVLAVSAWLIFRGVFAFSDYVAFSAVSGVFNLFAMGIVEVGLENQKAMQPRLRLSQMLTALHVDDHGQRMSSLIKSLRLSGVKVEGILRDVNASVGAGEHIVIVGPSGCGKTTLLKVMARLRGLSAGSYRVNNIDVDCLNGSDFVQKVQLVPQRPFIFDATIRENILLGLKGVGEEDLKQVVEDVGLRDYLESVAPNLAKGLNIRVSTDAKNVSGGQIARIALARALLRNPEVLLLDETTAALDDESERRICGMLHMRMAGRTIIAVSHRGKFINTFQRVISMDNGTIVDDRVVK